MSSTHTMCAKCNLDGVLERQIQFIAICGRAMVPCRIKTVGLIPANIGDRLPGQDALEPPKPHSANVTDFSSSPEVPLNASPCVPVSVARWSEDWKVVSVKRKLLKYPPSLGPRKTLPSPNTKSSCWKRQMDGRLRDCEEGAPD